MHCAMIEMLAVCAVGVCSGQTAVLLDDFEGAAAAEWSFSNGPEFPGAQGSFELSSDAAHDGTRGGRLHFDFTGGGAYVQAMLPLPAEPPLAAVELWVRKPVANRLTVRFVDQRNQTFQKSFNLARTDWQRIRVRFDTWAFSWGGPGDGHFHGWAKAFGILVERGETATGAVDIDGLVGIPRAEGTTMLSHSAEYVVTRFGEDDGWSFWTDGQAGGTLREGGTVRYDFAAGASAFNFGHDLSLLGKPEALRLTVDSDGSGHELRLTLYSHFQHFERSIGRLIESGETTFEAPLEDMSSWRHYGGEDDGVLRLPLRVGRLSIVRQAEGPERGEVVIRQLSVRTQVAPDSRLFPVARLVRNELGEPIFELSVASLLAQPTTADVSTRVRTFDGRVLLDSQDSLVLPGTSQSVCLTKPVPLGDWPFVEAQFTLTAPGQRPQQASATYVAPWPDAGSPELRPGSPWGMGLYLYRYPADPDGLTAMDQAAALAQAAGIKWSREEFLWHRIEPARGQFDWSFYDQVVETAQRHGISIYGLLDYWSEWTRPYTEEGIEDYCRYAQAVVARYKDRIKHWEIWNEPNIFFWSGPKEMYFLLLDRAYEAIKAVDPEATVFGCSTAGIDTSFIQRTIEAGARFDGLTIHPYRPTLDDAAFVRELRSVSDLVALAGTRRPVWITEMGWSTEIGGLSEREQASMLARCYLASVASGAVQNVSWYDFREDGTNPYYNEHHFGIVRQDLSLKPAYRAAATVCRTIGEARPVGFEEWASGVFACRFEREDGEILALWSACGGALVRFENTSGKFEAIGLMGDSLPLRRTPHYLSAYLPPRTAVFLRTQERGTRGAVTPLGAVVAERGPHPGESTRVELQLADLATGELTVSCQAPVGWSVRREALGSYLIDIAPNTAPGVYEIVFGLKSGEWDILLPVPVSVEPEVLEV